MKSALRWLGVWAMAALAAIAFGSPAYAHALRVDFVTILVAGVTLGTNVHTLTDVVKRTDPDGKIAAIVEVLGMTNEILEDALFKEGNLPTGERTTIRTGLPTVVWRLLNQGVQPSKSRTAQIDEQCAMLEAWCEIDEKLAKLNGNTAEYRFSEAVAFIEAMNQEMAQTLFYGNSSVSPEEFTGLAPRYSSLAAANGQNIVNAGGSGADNTSIWLCCWGLPFHGIYPQGSKAGLDHKDWDLQVAETTAGIGGTRMAVWRDQWNWDCGIALRDWRFVVRIANIDISVLIADTAGTTTKLVELMLRALNRVPNRGMGKLAFYANRTITSMLMIQAYNKSAPNVLSIEPAISQFGHDIHTLRFMGIPVRTSDSLIEAEAAVT